MAEQLPVELTSSDDSGVDVNVKVRKKEK